MNKLHLKENVTKLISFLKRLGKWVIILIALVIGFSINEIYHKYKEKVKEEIVVTKKTKTQVETSVAINESGEILIIDRKSGTFEVYSDTIGRMIFDLYSSKMLVEFKKDSK